MNTILTDKEVRDAIFVDNDFDSDIIQDYNISATYFVNLATGKDFVTNPHPLAKQVAKMYIRLRFADNQKGTYNVEYENALGIRGMLNFLKYNI